MILIIKLLENFSKKQPLVSNSGSSECRHLILVTFLLKFATEYSVLSQYFGKTLPMSPVWDFKKLIMVQYGNCKRMMPWLLKTS